MFSIIGKVRNKVNIPFVIHNRRIFIANLSKGRMGQDKSNLFGSLLVAQFQLAAMARSNQPESERVPFHLFVDEFQNFGTESFASILAEARKYRLSLTLSHQYIDQLTPAILSAVFGNVGNLIAFRVGHIDPEILSNEFGNEFNPNTFGDLPSFQGLAKIQDNEEPQPAFKVRFLLGAQSVGHGYNRAISKSRERFATRRAAIELRIKMWMQQFNT